jgi:hypothetical protein
MNFHFKNKMKTAFKNIYSFKCHYKEISVNEFHINSVTRHTHYVYLYNFRINSTLSDTLTHRDFLLLTETYD